MSRRSSFLCGGLLLALGAQASAAVLTTPMILVGTNQVAECILTNLGTKPIAATVAFTKFDGTTAAPFADNCNIQPLAPGKSCGWQADTAVPGVCSFDVGSAKVRAAGYVVNTVAPVTVDAIVPATR